jgi:hypothetical protein
VNFPEPNVGQPRQENAMQPSFMPASGYPMPQPIPVGAPGPVKAASVLLYVYSGFGLLGAVVMAAAGALGGQATDVPIAGMYAQRVVVVGFGGAALLVLLAAADIVLAIFLSRGRRWAQVGTVALSVVVGLVSLASPLGPLCVLAAIALVVLVLAPRGARRHFATR